jgi:Zn-finger nucleic acid-binding protein
MPEPMLCPLDKTPLVMSERQNIEIDYCPTCRGVWLDRGELDKIIERSAPEAAPARAAPPPPPVQGHAPHPGHGYQQPYGHHPYGKRKKSFLEELFD